jgi:hypothetical protein
MQIREDGDVVRGAALAPPQPPRDRVRGRVLVRLDVRAERRPDEPHGVPEHALHGRVRGVARAVRRERASDEISHERRGAGLAVEGGDAGVADVGSAARCVVDVHPTHAARVRRACDGGGRRDESKRARRLKK